MPLYTALDHTFRLVVGAPPLAEYLGHALASLAVAEGPADRTYRIHAHTEGWTLDDGESEESVPSPDIVARLLMWHINRRALDTQRFLGFHGGAVTRAGNCALVLGPSNAGKTTLTAGLVLRGMSYLTDELVTLRDGLVRPYPKPLVIGEGAHHVLPSLRPAVRDPELARRVWLVPPTTIRPDAVGRASPITHLFFVNYQGADRTVRRPLSSSQAAVRLVESVFEGRHHGRDALDQAGDIAAAAEAYDLVMHDLDAACDLVLDTMP